MSRPRKTRLLAWLTFVILTSFVGAVVEASGPHTDDGCAVELHCRVCGWSYASTAMVALPVVVGNVLEVAGYVPPARDARPADARPSAVASRGPPLS